MEQKEFKKKMIYLFIFAQDIFGKAIQSDESIDKMNGVRRCYGKSRQRLCTFSTK